MEDTEFYESKFEASLSDSELDLYRVGKKNKIRDSEVFDISLSGSRVNIYRVKKDKDSSSPCKVEKHKKEKVKHELKEYEQDDYDADFNRTITYKCSVSEEQDEFSPEFVVPTVPYRVNDNFGEVKRGSLVFVDHDGHVRSLYKVASPQAARIFEGYRFISISHSLNRFQIIRTRNGLNGKVSAMLDQVDNDGTVISYVVLSDITGTNANFAVSSFGNNTYVVGNNKMWAVDRGGRFLLNRPLPSINKENIHVVAAREKSFYTAGVINTNRIRFAGINFMSKIGYISHITITGSVAQIVAIKAKNLEFRGMYYHNSRLYITARYKGQFYLTKPLDTLPAQLPSKDLVFDNVEKIGVDMCDMASIIFALDSELNLVWWRLLVSSEPKYNIVGDITCNDNNEVFTTCRFKSNLGISEYNSIETDKSVTRDDEAFVLIGLTGENNCENKVEIPSDIIGRPLSWWRVIPAGFPPDTVSNYISIANNGYDFVISGYTDVSLSSNFVVSNHYFYAGFSPKMFDLYYHPIVDSVNNYNSRIIAISHDNLMTGSTAWNNLYVFPFGMLRKLTTQVGYYVSFSLNYPKLIGITVDRFDDKADVQYSGYTNVYKDARVGREYYISCENTTETQPRLTANNIGCNPVGFFGGTIDQSNVRYYGTAIKNGIIRINGFS